MIYKCPVCGKEFDVLHPDTRAFRRGNKFCCTYSCSRIYDERGKAKQMRKKLLTDEQERKAIEIAISGGDPKPYLAECGSKSPQTAWSSIRDKLKAGNPELYEKLPRNVGTRKRPNGPEDPEEPVVTMKVEGFPKPKPADSFADCQIRGLEHPVFGNFFYDDELDTMYWTPIKGGEEIGFKTVTWKNFISEIIPKMMHILGADGGKA